MIAIPLPRVFRIARGGFLPWVIVFHLRPSSG